MGFTLYLTMTKEPPPAISVEDTAPPDQLASNPVAAFSPLQDTLFHLARETGGRAWAGNPRGDVLGLVADDTRSYYWLGFTPTWKGDDEAHEVRVRVARPGLEARSRQGFKDLSRRSEVGNLMENALLFGQFEGALPLAVELGAVAPGGKDTVRVPLRIWVPLDRVAMLPRGERFEADLELRVEVLDDLGRRGRVPMIPVRLTGDQAPAPGELRPLRDRAGGAPGAARRGGGALRPGDRQALRDEKSARPDRRPPLRRVRGCGGSSSSHPSQRPRSGCW